MRAEFFLVSAGGHQIYINLSLVFRVQIDNRGDNSQVTFSFLNSPEQSATYTLAADRVAKLLERLAQ